MKVVLTMAGMGSRFKTAGYEQEKYAIPFRGHTLLEWSLVSLHRYRHLPLILIARDTPGVREEIERATKLLGFHNVEVLVIDYLTRGQADTAALARPYFAGDDDFLVFNTDTYVHPDAIAPEAIRGSGWIPTFDAPGDKWSFAEVGPDDRVVQTTEKVRISDHCSVGLYYFDSFFGYLDLLEQASVDSGENYIAPLYNAWIARGKDVYIHQIPVEQVTVLGTPDDLEQAERLDRPRWPLSHGTEVAATLPIVEKGT